MSFLSDRLGQQLPRWALEPFGLPKVAPKADRDVLPLFIQDKWNAAKLAIHADVTKSGKGPVRASKRELAELVKVFARELAVGLAKDAEFLDEVGDFNISDKVHTAWDVMVKLADAGRAPEHTEGSKKKKSIK